MLWGQEANAEPSDHVVIGDLPSDMTDQRLKDIFGAYGTVKWCRVDKGGKGAKAGQVEALLELDSVDEATYFVTALDQNIPEGLTSAIRVKYKPASKPKNKGAGKGAPMERASPYAPPAGGKGGLMGGKGGPMGGKGGFEGGKGGLGGGIEDVFKSLVRSGTLPGGKWANDENTVFVSGLPQDCTNNDLLRLFSPFGSIAPGGAYCMLNKEDGTCKGTGIINFLDSNGSTGAVSTLHGVMTPTGMSLRLRVFEKRG